MECGIGQRPKPPQRFDRIARIPQRLYRAAERVAKQRNMKTAAYLEEILRGPIEADAAALFLEVLAAIGRTPPATADPMEDLPPWPRPRIARPAKVRSELTWEDVEADAEAERPGPDAA